MEDIIINWIQEIMDSVNSVGQSGMLSQSLSQFNPVIYGGVSSIAKNISTPIAFSILSLFIMMELFQLTQRNEMNSLMGIELPLKFAVKLAICYTFVNVSFDLLVSIFDIALSMIHQMSSFGNGSLEQIDLNAFRNELKTVGIFGQLGVMIQVFLIWFVTKISILFATLLIVIRMLELYIYLAIAPIPLATLPHNEMSGIAKGFLKSFTAVCIQGIVMYLMLMMFNMLLGSIDGLGQGSGVYYRLWSYLGYSILLGFSLSGASRIAKSICNAM